MLLWTSFDNVAYRLGLATTVVKLVNSLTTSHLSDENALISFIPRNSRSRSQFAKNQLKFQLSLKLRWKNVGRPAFVSFDADKLEGSHRLPERDESTQKHQLPCRWIPTTNALILRGDLQKSLIVGFLFCLKGWFLGLLSFFLKTQTWYLKPWSRLTVENVTVNIFIKNSVICWGLLFPREIHIWQTRRRHWSIDSNHPFNIC